MNDSIKHHQFHEVYALGRVEQWLEDYARSSQIPAYELTRRVAELLLVQTSGPLLGPDDSVSSLRGNRSTRGKTTRSLEVVGRPHRKAQVKPKKHWTQLPKNRAKMQKILRQMKKVRQMQLQETQRAA